MEPQVATMGGGAAGQPGALAANLVKGEQKVKAAPAPTQLRLKGEEIAMGQAREAAVAILKTVFLVKPE